MGVWGRFSFNEFAFSIFVAYLNCCCFCCCECLLGQANDALGWSDWFDFLIVWLGFYFGHVEWVLWVIVLDISSDRFENIVCLFALFENTLNVKGCASCS